MKITVAGIVCCLFIWPFIFSSIQANEMIHQLDIERNYTHPECLSCHNNNSPNIVAEWSMSSHAKIDSAGKITADCVSCHGNLHQGSLSKSRPDSTCINCHGPDKAPLVHSYKTSKHGSIMRITASKLDWNKRLRLANYRVPGCAYCHMHDTNHNSRKTIRPKNLLDKPKHQSESILRQAYGVCGNCHAPRYTKRLFENGERMLSIARKKMTEAEQLLHKAKTEFSDNDLSSLQELMLSMQQHYKNVYLGIAHQSPDYQWWHGQPALDGDLIKIKGLISNLRRMSKIKLPSD